MAEMLRRSKGIRWDAGEVLFKIPLTTYLLLLLLLFILLHEQHFFAEWEDLEDHKSKMKLFQKYYVLGIYN